MCIVLGLGRYVDYIVLVIYLVLDTYLVLLRYVAHMQCLDLDSVGPD